MKTTLNRRPCAAFTLIEVLTVVAIVAMLATMTFAGLRFAQNKSRQKETISNITNINRCIEEYRAERGNYPRPDIDVKDKEITVKGETWIAGPAMALYQVLSGDGTDTLRGGEKESTGEQGSSEDEKDPSLGKIYMDNVKAPNKEQIADNVKMPLVEVDGDSFYLIDSWRHPFRFQVQEVDKNGMSTNLDEMHSASKFEIWSYGTLKKPDDTEAGKKEWIKSWDAN